MKIKNEKEKEKGSPFSYALRQVHVSLLAKTRRVIRHECGHFFAQVLRVQFIQVWDHRRLGFNQVR